MTAVRLNNGIRGCRKRILSVAALIIRYILLLAVGYIVLYPFLYMLVNSFKGTEALLDPSFMWIPRSISIEYYKTAWELLDFKNSLISTLTLQMVSFVIEVAVCSLIAYGFARFKFRGKKIAQSVLMLTLIVPLAMYGMSLALNYRSLDICGIFGLFNKLTGIDLRINIFNTNWTFWLPSLFGVGVRSGMIIYIYIQFFSGFPKELEEASYVDGANPFRTFFNIVLPSSGVAAVTVSVLAFIWHWNETYLASQVVLLDNAPLSIKMLSFESALKQIGLFIENGPEASTIVYAACVLFMVIPLSLYMLLQRKFVKSIDRVGIIG